MTKTAKINGLLYYQTGWKNLPFVACEQAHVSSQAMRVCLAPKVVINIAPITWKLLWAEGFWPGEVDYRNKLLQKLSLLFSVRCAELSKKSVLL